MWTCFYDMHSGGGSKTAYEIIFIEADSQDAAVDIFKREFKQSPDEVACDCCGKNFSVLSYDTLREASAYERGCDTEGNKWVERPRWGCLESLEAFLKRDDIRVIVRAGASEA